MDENETIKHDRAFPLVMLPTWFMPPFSLWRWIYVAVTGTAINYLAVRWALLKGHLTRQAALAAFAIGLTLWMIEPLFFVVLFVFFASSSLLSKLNAQKKKTAQDKAAKGSTRDVHQVLANGSIGLVMAIIYAIALFAVLPSWISHAAIFSSIAAIAAPNADTWATEVGMMSAKKPRWILDLHVQVETGTSGGVTLRGTTAAVAGALLVMIAGALIGMLSGLINLLVAKEWILVGIAGAMGFLASLVDSVIGATVQGTFQCQTCGKETEKRIHCSLPTRLVRGKGMIDNDVVNFLASAFAGGSTFLITALILAW
nr:DUF92 domain-containing protein [Candidatus Sigynarchaeota archaeon]